jgi:DNA polymerase-1
MFLPVTNLRKKKVKNLSVGEFMHKKLYLIDGTALIYRAYFAFIRNPLFNSKGENTSAIYGTVNSFLKLLEDFKPDHIGISFDRKGKTFRNDLSQEYKANRPPAPEDLISQIKPIQDFFKQIGLEEISCEGYEADDVLATLAQQNKENFEQIIIVSGDKDFAQLVDDKILLYDPTKKKQIDREAVMERYNITPKQFIDYLAICGDSADNIPGIKGIGPKGAAKLLNDFGNLENIYKNIENITAKSIKKKLIENKENAFLSQKLAKIIRDVKLDVHTDFNFHIKQLIGGYELLKRYELNSLAKRLKELAKVEPEIENKQEDLLFADEFDFSDPEDTNKLFQAELIETKAEFDKLLIKLEKADYVAIDTETTGLDPIRAELVGISLCCEPEKAFYLPLKHQMAKNLETRYVLRKLEKTLAEKLLIAHNIKYDYHILKRAGWEIKNKVFDTMIAHYLINPTKRHSLDNCAKTELNYQMTPIKNLIGIGKKQITFDLVPTSQACEYAAEDANITFRLYDIFAQKLENLKLTDLFDTIEMPLFYVLAQMEENGVHLDVDLLSKLSKKNQKRIGELTNKIFKLAGTQFNINSPQQLGNVLFVTMGIPPVKTTKTGFSTDLAVLEKLAKDYEIARLIIEYRHLNKMESTYIKALPELINPNTERLHSSFNQAVTSTGRLSSSDPNLQNIPIRSALGKEIRKAFCAKDDNHLIIAADYSQIELRVLAMISGDEKMKKAFLQKQDIHKETAAIIYNLPKEEITSNHRRYAKVINFGLMYGMGASRISKELSITRKEATAFIENYFDKFPTIQAYIQNGIKQAHEYGYVATIFGRRLYLPDLQSKNGMRRSAAERVAINMPIQGSAADILKLAMINLQKKLKKHPKIKMMIQVHDELVFEVHKSELEFAKEIIRYEMENVLPANMKSEVPLVVDIGTGQNWLEAH